MLVPPAIELGITLSLFASDAGDSGAQVASHIVGDYRDVHSVLEWAKSCDVVTFEHEQVPQEVVTALESAGVVVYPASATFEYSQDKLAMREKMSDLGLPNPQWQKFTGGLSEIPFPLIAKTSTGGYDGRGVFVLSSQAELDELYARVGAPLLLEEKLPFDYELAVMVARSAHGLTVQRDGICTLTVTPIPDVSPELASEVSAIALAIAQGVNLVGVMAVELFVVQGKLVINELAMRPHNSGHWSIEGAKTSQFEQHLRAVLNLPLGDTSLTADYTVMGNVIGIETDKDGDLYRPYLHLMARTPSLKIHQYLKELRTEVEHAVAYLSGAIDE